MTVFLNQDMCAYLLKRVCCVRQAAERFVVWFFGDRNNKTFKIVLSGKEGAKSRTQISDL